MSAAKDGGPAFPVPSCQDANGQICWGTDGMTLRDYFAAAALTGCLAGWDKAYPYNPEIAAEYSYRQADEMMAKKQVNGSSREIAHAKADALREVAGQFSGYHDDANWYADDICIRLNDAADEIIREANK